STYDSQLAFGSTLLNRPLDQAFVLDALTDPDTLGTDLAGRIDASKTAVIGYSMGGYGALIFGGAGVTKAATELQFAPPHGALAAHLAGSDSHSALMDDRLAAVIAIGPWGRNAGFWDDAGLAGLRVPTMIMAGSVDTVSGYDALREIFAGATGTTRHLLTFQNAGHNAAAPIPAPAESWPVSEKLGWAPFGHYADPVWDTMRMNNVAQHFATAFLDLHLKGDVSGAGYLDLVPNGVDGVWSVKDGVKGADHSYWSGFEQGSAAGLTFETLPKP
ncbi:MAG: dienelactone hydrolase, partial [Gemmobacter sp.]|nr:dienelactone hydrolase [Gemmobacter sp.]